jgi:hypothetical protein
VESNNRAAGAPQRHVVPLKSVGVDPDAVRTFAAAADAGQFQEAAAGGAAARATGLNFGVERGP